MFGKELVVDIIWSIEQITKKFQSIRASGDFTRDDLGLEKPDSIRMQVINVGAVWLNKHTLNIGVYL